MTTSPFAMRLAFLALMLAATALASGCRTTSAPAPMDASLRRTLDAVPADSPIDVLIGIGTADADVARHDLTAAGLDVRTVAGGVAIGRGVKAAIERAAGLPFVERIELSQDRFPTPERP